VCATTPRPWPEQGYDPTERGIVPLSDQLIALLNAPSICYLATTMPSGSPQLTQTWVDTDGEHVVINSVTTHQKVRNVKRDPRVAVAVSDPKNPGFFIQVRGRVVDLVTDGAVDHIEKLSQKYTGKPYPWYGGRDQERIILVIEADHVSSPH
jgi:PPOX class probable F420-dependent enzyme